MRTVLRRPFALLATLMLAAFGCGGSLATDPGPGKRVDVTVAKDAYISGDTVIAIVKNVSDVTLTYPYGFCKTALQRQLGGEWTTASPPSDGCPLALGLLGPGASVPQAYLLPSDVSPGLYRLTMPSPVPKDAQTPEPDLTTPPFSINSVTFNGSM